MCRFRITDAGGELLAEDAQPAAAAFQVDLDGDKVPELVVSADTGGGRGFHNNYILTQRPQPRLIKTFIDACAITPRQSSAGVALMTCDVLSPAIPDLCGGCAPPPAVFITLEGGALRDRSERSRAEYDADIDRLLHQLTGAGSLRSSGARDRTSAAYQSEAKGVILGIVLDYLYSGREAAAREALSHLCGRFPERRPDAAERVVLRSAATCPRAFLPG